MATKVTGSNSGPLGNRSSRKANIKSTSATFSSPTNALTVVAKDALGNTASGYTGTVHFTSTDSQATLPADYAFAPADGGVHIDEALGSHHGNTARSRARSARSRTIAASCGWRRTEAATEAARAHRPGARGEGRQVGDPAGRMAGQCRLI